MCCVVRSYCACHRDLVVICCALLHRVTFCLVLYCIVLYCIVSCCIVLYCVILYCVIWNRVVSCHTAACSICNLEIRCYCHLDMYYLFLIEERQSGVLVEGMKEGLGWVVSGGMDTEM